MNAADIWSGPQVTLRTMMLLDLRAKALKTEAQPEPMAALFDLPTKPAKPKTPSRVAASSGASEHAFFERTA